jgi:hypothetical protein
VTPWSSRWGLPLGIGWAGILVSAWVFERKLPPAAQEPTWGLVAVLLGVPLLSLTTLVVVRVASRGPTSFVGDQMVAWLMLFGLAVHLALLGDALGAAPPVGRTVPWAVAGLLVGLGLWFRYLPWKDAMGLRLPSLLNDERAWMRTHQRVGWGLVAMGVSSPWVGWVLSG